MECSRSHLDYGLKKLYHSSMNIFDIIGPVMIGPSSSHTAGAARLGKIALHILGERLCFAEIILYGSFAKTHKGHGTDLALVAGLIGLQPDDERLKMSFELAKEKGIEFKFFQGELKRGMHPNSVKFKLKGKKSERLIVGASVGGGRIIVSSIDGFDVNISGEYPTVVTLHEDKPGMVGRISTLLATYGINIAQMRVSRSQKGGTALMVVETDNEIPKYVEDAIKETDGIKRAITIAPL